MAAEGKKHRRGGKTNRKHRRNYRWAGVDHSTTKYRLLHHIDPAAKKRKAKGE
jgi:hypothetical protein